MTIRREGPRRNQKNTLRSMNEICNTQKQMERILYSECLNVPHIGKDMNTSVSCSCFWLFETIAPLVPGSCFVHDDGFVDFKIIFENRCVSDLLV